VRIHPSVSRKGNGNPFQASESWVKNLHCRAKEVLLSESLWCLWGIAKIEHLHDSSNFDEETKTTANYGSVILLIPINKRERERERHKGSGSTLWRWGV
jgi:hypothetical protein